MYCLKSGTRAQHMQQYISSQQDQQYMAVQPAHQHITHQVRSSTESVTQHIPQCHVLTCTACTAVTPQHHDPSQELSTTPNPARIRGVWTQIRPERCLSAPECARRGRAQGRPTGTPPALQTRPPPRQMRVATASGIPRFSGAPAKAIGGAPTVDLALTHTAGHTTSPH